MTKLTSNKFAAGIAIAAALLGLAAFAPAFADMSSNQSGKVWNGPMMGPGRGGMRRHITQPVQPGIFGTVASISGTTLTVTGRTSIQMMRPASTTPPTSTTTFIVDASAATVIKNNATTTLASVAANDQVFIQGTVNGSSVIATIIRDGMPMMRPGDKGQGGGPAPAFQGNGEPVVAGTVSALSGNTFSITNSGGASFSVDATNAVVRKGNATSTVSAIAMGDRVLVQGTVNGSSVTASSVFDQAAIGNGSNKGPGKARFLGSLGSLLKRLFNF